MTEIQRDKVRDLEALLEISRQMVATRELNSLLDLVLRRATQLLDAERSSLFVLDEEAGELWTTIAQELAGHTIRVPLGKGIVGHVAELKTPLRIDDAYADPRFNREVDRETGFRTRSILCCPMLNHEGACTGVIEVLNKRGGGTFGDYDEELLQALASHAAVAITNSKLYEQNQTLFRSVVKTLAAAIDARDPVTAGHSERVTQLALNIGHALALDEEQMSSLELAALLHDVGKLGVRDDVLLKADRLTADEYSQMKEHAVFTDRILSSIEFPRGLRDIPRIASLHHERVDGKGYPNGLTDKEIGVIPRILAVVDVFDALVSWDRPYSKARSVEEALAILESGRGSQFDASIVDLFVDKKLYQVERREYRRINTKVSLEYWVLPDARVEEKLNTAATVDLSASGLAFRSRTSIPSTTFLEMVIHLPDQAFNVIAQVVRCARQQDDVFRVAVRFVNPSDKVQRLLDGNLRQLNASDSSPE